MSEALAGILHQAANEAFAGQAVKNSQTPNSNGRSFESFMRQTDGAGGQRDVATENGVQSRLDELQDDLAKKIGDQAGSKPGPDKIPAELLDSKTRLGLLREAFGKLGSSPSASGFQGKFLQIEGEYKQVEAIMASDKNLSPGELLALQARLYQVSQHIEVMSKVVDQMAGGIKTVLNTNV